jgi:lipoate-protein ligase A
VISDRRNAWRLLVDRESPGDWNMAVDEAILDAVAARMVPPTIRLYRWDGAAVSLGRFQNRERDFDEELSRKLGIGFVRRPTGGRGILHGHDQTVSIIVPIHILGETGRRIIESYVYLARGFAHRSSPDGM